MLGPDMNVTQDASSTSKGSSLNQIEYVVNVKNLFLINSS